MVIRGLVTNKKYCAHKIIGAMLTTTALDL